MQLKAKRSARKRILIVAFVMAAGSDALAQDGHLLQQRASFAYREMQLAERETEQAVIEAKEIDGQITELQKQLEAARKRSATAHAHVKATQVRAAEARKRWNDASEALDKARPADKP